MTEEVKYVDNLGYLLCRILHQNKQFQLFQQSSVTKVVVKSVTGLVAVVTSVTLSVEFVALELILIDEFFDMIIEEIVQSERLIQTNRWFWICLNIEFSKRIIMGFGSILTDFYVIIHSMRWNPSCATCKLALWGVEVQIMSSLSKIQNSEKSKTRVTFRKCYVKLISRKTYPSDPWCQRAILRSLRPHMGI